MLVSFSVSRTLRPSACSSALRPATLRRRGKCALPPARHSLPIRRGQTASTDRLIAGDLQRGGGDVIQLRPAQQGILPAMGDPELFRLQFLDRKGQLVPIGMVDPGATGIYVPGGVRHERVAAGPVEEGMNG